MYFFFNVGRNDEFSLLFPLVLPCFYFLLVAAVYGEMIVTIHHSRTVGVDVLDQLYSLSCNGLEGVE